MRMWPLSWKSGRKLPSSTRVDVLYGLWRQIGPGMLVAVLICVSIIITNNSTICSQLAGATNTQPSQGQL